MLLFHLTIKTYLSTCHHNYLCTCLYLYPFMAVPVHFHTFIPINHLDLPVNVSTVLYVHRCTWSSLYCSACPQMYLFSLFLLFRHNMHNDLSTHSGYQPTDQSKNKFTHLPSCFSFAQEQRPTCHHNYLCTCPYMYTFMTLPVHFHTFIQINH